MTTAINLFAIQVVLFGGFLWLEPSYYLPSGFWIMIAGLAIGFAATSIDSERSR